MQKAFIKLEHNIAISSYKTVEFYVQIDEIKIKIKKSTKLEDINTN